MTIKFIRACQLKFKCLETQCSFGIPESKRQARTMHLLIGYCSSFRFMQIVTDFLGTSIQRTMDVIPERVRNLLNKNRSEVIKRLDIKHGLLEELHSADVLTDEHVESIEICLTRREQIVTLLDILKRRSYGDYRKFIEILRFRQPDVAKLINEILNDY